MKKAPLKTFYVLWTYVSNFSELRKIAAESEEVAYKMATAWYSDEFHRQATIYVFDKKPVFQCVRGVKMTESEIE